MNHDPWTWECVRFTQHSKESAEPLEDSAMPQSSTVEDLYHSLGTPLSASLIFFQGRRAALFKSVVVILFLSFLVVSLA